MELAQEKRTVCLLETPYRFNQLIEACAEVMGERNAYIGMNLTMRYETHHYGTFNEIKDRFKDEKIKAEFVLVFEAAPYSYSPPKKAFGTRKFNKFDDNRDGGERRDFKRRDDDNRGGGERRDFKKKEFNFEEKKKFGGKSTRNDDFRD